MDLIRVLEVEGSVWNGHLSALGQSAQGGGYLDAGLCDCLFD